MSIPDAVSFKLVQNGRILHKGYTSIPNIYQRFFALYFPDAKFIVGEPVYRAEMPRKEARETVETKYHEQPRKGQERDKPKTARRRRAEKKNLSQPEVFSL